MPARNELGSQPIHWAASGGHVPVVDLLLEAGATIDATDNKEQIIITYDQLTIGTQIIIW